MYPNIRSNSGIPCKVKCKKCKSVFLTKLSEEFL